MAVEHLTKLNDDGTLFGQSTTDKIGFYGLTTPIVQPTITLTTTATTTVLKVRVARIEAALVALALVNTGG